MEVVGGQEWCNVSGHVMLKLPSQQHQYSIGEEDRSSSVSLLVLTRYRRGHRGISINHASILRERKIKRRNMLSQQLVSVQPSSQRAKVVVQSRHSSSHHRCVMMKFACLVTGKKDGQAPSGIRRASCRDAQVSRTLLYLLTSPRPASSRLASPQRTAPRHALVPYPSHPGTRACVSK